MEQEQNDSIVIPDNLPDTKKHAPKYIPIETILKLHEKNLSSSQIATLVGCGASAIRSRLATCRDILKHTENFKSNRADVLAFHQQKVLSKLTLAEVKPPKTSRDLKDAVTAFGILYDKERLERGQTTVNIDFPIISKKLQAIKEEREKLRQKRIQLTGVTVTDMPQSGGKAHAK
jgi:hypothetical protein